MSNILIKDVPQSIHNWIREFAKSKNISVNKACNQLIIRALKNRDQELKEVEYLFESTSLPISK